MAVYVAIPTYNRKDKLERCVACFENQDTPAELIVVCNATSTDGTEEMLSTRHPRVLSLRCSDDNWWTGTINVCLREILKRCKPDDYILCINDDVEVDPDYLMHMLAAVRKSPKRAVGSVAVDIEAPDVIDDGGNRINWITAKFTRVNYGRRLSDFPTGHEEKVSVLSGRGVIYPARAFLELGLMAPALLSLGADYEFSVRCERAGYELVTSYVGIVKSYVKPTTIHDRKGRISLRSAIDYFTNPRSTGNLRDRLIFSRLTRRNPVQGLSFLILSQGRQLWRFLRGSEQPGA